MKLFSLAVLLILTIQLTAGAQSMNPKQLAAAWDSNHISHINPSDVRHGDLKKYLEELRNLGLKVEEVGKSYGDREIYQVEWGVGPLKVFLWSQMHGDEPTATSAMIDMLGFFKKNASDEWVRSIHDAVSIRFVPMLNPDGAELYQRRNLQGIDINRDAAGLRTPEGQLLKRLRDSWKPEIGFNLHNQGELTTAGDSARQAAISFLAVLGDPKGVSTPAYEKNKRIIGAMASALNTFIEGHVGRYDDSYNGLAFGDNFSAWGTPVILIETGALHGKDELYLVKMNFIALATALDVLASRTDGNFESAIYERIPMNESGRLMDVIFRNAQVVLADVPGKAFRSDIGIVRERRRASFTASTVIKEMGALQNRDGLTEYDVSDFNVIHRFNRISVGGTGDLLFYKKSRKIDWSAPDLEKAEKPDAVYSIGTWLSGGALMSGKETSRKPSN